MLRLNTSFLEKLLNPEPRMQETCDIFQGLFNTVKKLKKNKNNIGHQPISLNLIASCVNDRN